MDSKVCTKCGEEKELSEFNKKKNAKGGRTCDCKECNKIACREYYQEHKESIKLASREYFELNRDKVNNAKRAYAVANPERVKAACRKGNLKFNYQISPEEYSEMLASQGYVCAICGAEQSTSSHGRLQVDHCHETGKVRGLLCHTCNSGIAFLQESPTVMWEAIKYLEEAKLNV